LKDNYKDKRWLTSMFRPLQKIIPSVISTDCADKKYKAPVTQ